MRSKILEILESHLQDLKEKSRNSARWAGVQVARELDSIRDAIAELMTSEERALFLKLVLTPGKAADGDILLPNALTYCQRLMSFCRETEARPPNVVTATAPNRPAHVASSTAPSEVPQTKLDRLIPQTRNVFIVHGHDVANTLRLQNLLRDRYALNPIILSEKASMGRSIIEKFEEEATSISFAIALLTPDDQITKDGKQYPQARPNVIFELGWFYGRLGRKRVCILFRKGTEIHSDLHGMLRVEFSESVEEAVIGLERELKAAGLMG